MATMTIYLPLDGPNDILWLAGPATVADSDTYSFVNPYNDNTVVVTGKDFVFDDNNNPIGGTYDHDPNVYRCQSGDVGRHRYRSQ